MKIECGRKVGDQCPVAVVEALIAKTQGEHELQPSPGVPADDVCPGFLAEEGDGMIGLWRAWQRQRSATPARWPAVAPGRLLSCPGLGMMDAACRESPLTSPLHDGAKPGSMSRYSASLLLVSLPAARGDVRGDQDGSMSGEISPTGKPSGPGSSPELRASHADRDRVVDVLRIAAGDGLLTADELDERVEAALSARTLSDLTPLTADLPPVSAAVGVDGAEVKDVVRIEQVHSGAIERVGRWVVPRRMELAVTFCAVTLDFTDAVITHDTLRIDVGMTGKTLTLVTRPGIVVDTNGLHLVHTRVRHRQTPMNPDTPVTLRVELVGRKVHGHVVVRPPRRTFGQWLLRRPRSLSAGT